MTTFVTAQRAKAITGDDHYLVTKTRILVDRYVPPTNPTDAALDEAFADEDENESETPSSVRPESPDSERPGVMRVEVPFFVLGLDVSATFVLLGGLLLLFAALMRRNRPNRRESAMVDQGASAP